MKASAISPNLNHRIRSLKRNGSPELKVNEGNGAATKLPAGLPLISKLDSEGDSVPDAGSDEDLNLDDDEDLGALNAQMNRNSVVGASSGRGFANFKYKPTKTTIGDS